MRLPRLAFARLVVAGLAAGLLVAACGEGVITDPNFHTWCGDSLCAWKLESGQIARAPTWNAKDYGVELLDSTDATHVTAISQTVTQTPKCLEFSAIADVVPEAQVTIGVDFDGDGTVEYEQPIVAVGFVEQRTQVTAPLAYASIKFTITKKGTGHAVLAQIDVTATDNCTAPPVSLEPQRIGTPCAGDGSACRSGVCCEGVCAECCARSVLSGDGDAGNTDPFGHCADGAKCDKLPLISFGALPKGEIGIGPNVIPRQCDPGTRKRPDQAECLLDADCTSGHCEGALWELEQLAINGPPCPPPPAQADDCVVRSVRAGVCK